MIIEQIVIQQEQGVNYGKRWNENTQLFRYATSAFIADAWAEYPK